MVVGSNSTCSKKPFECFQWGGQTRPFSESARIKRFVIRCGVESMVLFVDGIPSAGVMVSAFEPFPRLRFHFVSIPNRAASVYVLIKGFFKRGIGKGYESFPARIRCGYVVREGKISNLVFNVFKKKRKGRKQNISQFSRKMAKKQPARITFDRVFHFETV